MRPNRQYPRIPTKQEVDLDFRGHSRERLCKTTKNRFLDIEIVKIVEITEIHKTKSTVPWSTSETGSWPGFSRSLEHGSFVTPRKIDSSISKT